MAKKNKRSTTQNDTAANVGYEAQLWQMADARRELARVFPTADEIVSGMSLRLTFKDVTDEVLEKFKDKVLMSFSRSALPESLLEEYDAARERTKADRTRTA